MVNEWHYLLPALVGATALAMIAGPFGAVMVWRRMSYLGDTISHSGLLGVTLAIILNINITLGVCAIALIVALLLFRLQRSAHLAADTILGLLSHTMLALGLLLLSFFQFIRVDILSFLYGDILAIGWDDVLLIILCGTLLLIVLSQIWISLMRVMLHAELASVEGVSVSLIQVVFLILLSVMIAMAMKMVGVLLITALLIIPAAAARFFAHTPFQMVMQGSLLGVVSVIIGVTGSHFFDVPTGPAIVVAAAGLFIFMGTFKRLFS